MEFNVNHPLIFVFAGIIVAAVLAQSIWFLRKALRRSKEIGMDQKKIRKMMLTAGIFTIAPAVAIVISVLALSQSLGLALPWLRLSVVGSLSYEAIAAANAESAMGLDLSNLSGLSLTASQFVTITLVMTLSILVGIWLVPLLARRMQNGMLRMDKRDQKWADIFSASMFIGMISAFVGYVFCDFDTVFRGDTSGLIPVCVMLASALAMAVCGLLLKKCGWKWIGDYALPISLVLGMASAIPITAWLG